MDSTLTQLFQEIIDLNLRLQRSETENGSLKSQLVALTQEAKDG